MNRYFLFVALLLSLATGNAGATDVAWQGMLNSDQAIQRAQAFFKAVGWTPERDLIAVPEDQDRLLKRDVWEVRTGDNKLTVDVNRHTGAIAVAIAFRKLDGDPKLPLITKSLALKRCASYFRIANVSMKGLEVELNGPTKRQFDSKEPRWQVVYRRKHNGYSFERDRIVFFLNPNDGSLASFSNHIFSPLPTTTRIVLDKKQAAQSASDYFNRVLGSTIGTLKSLDVAIVQPNDYWEYRAAGQMTPADLVPEWTSRLAYLLEFDAPYVRTQIWVDTENGHVLGGVASATPLVGELASGPVVYGAVTMIIDPMDPPRRAPNISMETPDGKAAATALRLLRRTSTSRLDKPIRLVFQGNDRTYEFRYSAVDHRLLLEYKSIGERTIRGNIGWETTKEFDDLIAKLGSS